MVTHKKTKKKRILMMRVKKLVAKELISRNSSQGELNDSNGVHK
ncbi:hypothetical protein [uncultured Clostridium sp.]|jgi:hypothetical protein|nr:hypothetical protein [uncultured Clostridium sp.]